MKNVNEVLLCFLIISLMITSIKSIKLENKKLLITEFLQDYRNITVSSRNEASRSTLNMTVFFIYYKKKKNTFKLSNYNSKGVQLAKGLYDKSRYQLG